MHNYMYYSWYKCTEVGRKRTVSEVCFGMPFMLVSYRVYLAGMSFLFYRSDKWTVCFEYPRDILSLLLFMFLIPVFYPMSC